jgi:hypothetical protein
MYIIKGENGDTTPVFINRIDGGDSEFTADGVRLLAISEDGISIRVGRKAVLLSEREARALFALLHTMNVDTDGRLGAPAIYQLKKDTGVPF